MIDPIIFTIPGTNIAIHWYGVLMAAGVFAAGWVTAIGVRRRGEDPEYVWDGLIWAIPAGIIGARLWYCANVTLGGSRYYLEDPVRILRVWEGGLHFYGAVLFGGLAAYIYFRVHQLDFQLLLDAVAPALLIGQAVVRPANFINQELYGPPTNLPWGIRIEAARRIRPWVDLTRYPVETTRFHPTFAYEIIWNVLAAALLLWAARRYAEKLKPGALFAGWLVLEGVGRFWLEWFRPDQPVLPGTAISYSRIVAVLMAIAGGVWLLIRYEVVRVPFLSPGPSSYAHAPSDGSEPESKSEPELEA
jgi:phosphatidylglycerol:prolipoprotein diacylglycerol transferase